MNLVTGNIKEIYKKYLLASFGGAILPSVYGLVDMMAVGQYHGPIGSATMAIIAPIWNVVYSCGMLTGIGGSILFNIAKNSHPKDTTKSNGYFTVGLLITALLSVLLWGSLICFEEDILRILGADDTLVPLALQYLIPVKFTLPVYLFMMYMASFLRNDDHPDLATKAVMTGGVFNIVGDVFFVFVLDLGILGAGMATCLGATLSLTIMLTHFKSPKNTLKLVPPKKVLTKTKRILSLGFSTFFVDIAMGILTMLFNIQIMRYLGSDALAIYGIIVNVATFVQCCAYGVGQASQPILSANYGAEQHDRIRLLFRYNVVTIIVLSLLWFGATLLFPTAFVHIFMTPTPEVLAMAPTILRLYGTSFLLLPFNVYATYYFQSVMKQQIAFFLSVGRGLVISSGFILILPVLFDPSSIWFAMTCAELVTFFLVLLVLKRENKNPR
ncbi:MAG: MATE family efflux transporter [Eubacteriales bacterium]